MREKRNRLDSASSYGSLTRKGVTSSTIWQKHSQEDSQDRRCCSGRSPSRSIASKSSRNYSAMTTATHSYLKQIRQIERREVHRISIQHYPLLPIPVIATVHKSRNAPPLLVNPRLSEGHGSRHFGSNARQLRLLQVPVHPVHPVASRPRRPDAAPRGGVDHPAASREGLAAEKQTYR